MGVAGAPTAPPGYAYVANCSHTCFRPKQYNLVLDKRQWCLMAGKETAGLTESEMRPTTGCMNHLCIEFLETGSAPVSQFCQEWDYIDVFNIGLLGMLLCLCQVLFALS